MIVGIVGLGFVGSAMKKSFLEKNITTIVYDKYKDLHEILKQAETLSKADLDKTKVIANLEFDKQTKLKDTKRDYEKKLTDMKSQYENKVQDMKREAIVISTQLQSAHDKAFAEFKQKTAAEYYERLKDEFTELQKDGDKNSKFVQELALKVMEKAPPATTRIEYSEETSPKRKRR